MLPPTSVWTARDPAAMYTNSTSKPWRWNMPASLATQGIENAAVIAA
jgi:hypothetical protein